MVLILLLFAAGTVAPILAVLWLTHMEMFHFVLNSVVALAVVAILAMLAWRLVQSWRVRRGSQSQGPNGSRVARLAWRRDLTQSELEAHCATYLRHQGWAVVPVRSNAADGVFLLAARTGARALLMCQPSGEHISPIALRSLASAAELDRKAKPVALTLGGAAQAAANAALGLGVAIISPTDLPQLGRIAATVVPAELAVTTASKSATSRPQP